MSDAARTTGHKAENYTEDENSIYAVSDVEVETESAS